MKLNYFFAPEEEASSESVNLKCQTIPIGNRFAKNASYQRRPMGSAPSANKSCYNRSDWPDNVF